MDQTTMSFIWLGVVVLATFVELGTTQLVSVWFVVGGLAALIVALCGGPLWLQVGLFFVVTILSLMLTRPLVRQIIHAKKTKTNADRYVGMEAVVTAEINNALGEGLVNVSGSIWSARNAESDQIIPVGAAVRVEAIQGVKLMVSLVKVPAQVG